CSSSLMDTRASAQGGEVDLVLYTESSPSTATQTPPFQVAANEPWPVQEPEDTTEHEEQEISTRSPAAGSGRHPGSAAAATASGTTTFFQIATQGQAIVYVVDRSGSMALNGCFAAAKRELLASLERLPSSVRFQVIAYNRVAEPLRINGHSSLVVASPENKRYVALALEEIHAEGSTQHVGALKRALALGPDVIFFLTDADGLRPDEIQAISSL